MAGLIDSDPVRHVLLDGNRHIEVLRQRGREALRVARLAHNVRRGAVTRVSRQAALACLGLVRAHQAGDVEREPLLVGPIERGGGLPRSPGAIEQRQRAMVEQVGEVLERPVLERDGPVIGQLRGMQRQRPLRAPDTQPEQPDVEPAVPRVERSNLPRRKGKHWTLPNAVRFL
ncbi:hypothetical protein D3C86_1267770 [compost metagenome]